MTKSNSAQFEAWWSEYQRSQRLGEVRLGASREDLRRLFGEPDAVGRGFGKHRQTGIWKYGDIEFHFGLDGGVWMIYTEDEEGTPREIAKRQS